jgi:hypothetical protein
LASVLFLLPTTARAQDLIVDNATVTLGGVHYYDSVQIINGGVVWVAPFDGSDRVNTGNLQIVADSIYIDATSGIAADGRGYQPVFCDDGDGPTASAGGRGGCAVRDSGGGGAHFGVGGRGTIDNPPGFPQGFEEDCGHVNGSVNGCVNDCSQNGDALPTVAGQPYRHSIYEVEFGAAGGDRGCRDGDGWSNPCMTAGAGGGRVVLAAVTPGGTGTLVIEGRVSANGWRGCGNGNDSAGGGAGGSVLLVGDSVTTTASAYIAAAGGLGGDTLGTPPDPADPFGQSCPACAQSGGTCDDCGGGGGGGIVSVLSGTAATLDPLTQFDVAGAAGGTCTNGNCIGEAGGGAGELQLNGLYRGEFCDGLDNDFDGLVDEGLGTDTCGSGSCQVTVDQCTAGLPNDCVPTVDPACQDPISDTRSRFLVIMDTSGSMLLDLNGEFTFGDGSAGHEGVDTDGDGTAGNDSRLFVAKEALADVVSAYIPDIDFGLARFAQGSQANANCQLAHWFECAGICCTYDNPVGNTGTVQCAVAAGAMGNLDVRPTSPAGDQCINYAGSCGAPRRGADVLVGFERPVGQLLMWMDHAETSFSDDQTPGDHCSFGAGGDCELRGTGPTPLADSLYAAKDYLARAVAEDAIGTCRQYGVILLTDGTETCRGDPVAAAAELLSDAGIETYVIGFSVLPSEETALDAIANAGSASGTRDAIFAGDQNELAAALASIVADSVVFELCNGGDDDCDGDVDEDFPLGQPCDDGLLGICRGTGQLVCSADELGVQCQIDNPGQPATAEVCDGLDNDCDGEVDEDDVCCNGPELCNGVDDYCGNNPSVSDGDEDPRIWQGGAPRPCGSSEGECVPGQMECLGGTPTCVGAQGPWAEQCDALDHNCNGLVNDVPPDLTCVVQPTTYGSCPGVRICDDTGAWGACTGQPAGPEICNGQDDNCDGQADEGLDYTFTCGVGACEHPVVFCSGGTEGICDPLQGASPELWADPNLTPGVCDQVDQDCDGVINNGIPDRTCTRTNGAWTCAGTETCTAQGTWVGCTAPNPEAESCNNLDDNCNGLVDENVTQGCYTGPAATDQVGECSRGTRTCTQGAWGGCVGQQLPVNEVCDGLDNDCDGDTDEDAGGQPLTRACQQSNAYGTCLGVQTCTGVPADPWSACSAALPAAEACNGQDDDCDGIIDGITQACYSFATGCAPDGQGGFNCQGLCLPGTRTCPQLSTPAGSNAWGACQLDRGPAPEVCDGLDNDCDGDVDESSSGSPLERPCYFPGYGPDTGCTAPGSCVGACREGVQICGDLQPGDWGACQGDVAPTQETCDGTDNDCDGDVDEPGDLPWIGQPCPAQAGVCNGIWDCQAGQKICVGGSTQPGRCNGLDDDCDGVIDELDELQQDPQFGQACGQPEGECEEGALECVGGAWVCVGAVEPSEEVCDGLDNDCNEVVDDQAPCEPVGDLQSYCIEGDCRVECASGEFPCPGGQECVQRTVDGQSVSVCLPTVGDCGGVDCPPGWICEDDVCVDPCDGVFCEDWEECRGGLCVDVSCSGLGQGCPPGEFCVDHACAEDPCAAAQCDPLLSACRRDCDAQSCTASCEPVCQCPLGQWCDDTDTGAGACVQEPCQGVDCEPGQRCDPGSQACEPDPCADVTCGGGSACFEGECVPDPCALLQCPLYYRCEVHPEEDGAGGLEPTAECRPDPAYWEAGDPGGRYLAAGAGCQCGTRPAAPPAGRPWRALPWGALPWSLLLGGLLWRRRRARRRDTGGGQ